MLGHALLGAALDVFAVVAGAPPDETFNDFLPTERGLGECISALPKPGCGSEARGGWRQWLVLALILAGLAFISWRVWTAARHARAVDAAASPGAAATAAPSSDAERTP